MQQLSALGNLDGVDRKQFQSTNINKLAEGLIESLAPWVYQTYHSIAFEESGQLIVPAIGSLIRDALRNLIENAVKHTQAGTLITVRVGEDSTVGVYDNAGPPRWPETPVERDDGNMRGIGLEIIDRIATIHGSAFRFEKTRNGSNAVISFPMHGGRSID